MSEQDKIETRRTVFAPAVDIAEKENEFIIWADVPGAENQGVDLDLDGDLLRVTVKVTSPEVGELPLIYREFETGDFETSFRVSQKVDKEKIKAEIKDGVLTVTLPKAAEAVPRKIKVKAA